MSRNGSWLGIYSCLWTNTHRYIEDCSHKEYAQQDGIIWVFYSLPLVLLHTGPPHLAYVQCSGSLGWQSWHQYQIPHPPTENTQIVYNVNCFFPQVWDIHFQNLLFRSCYKDVHDISFFSMHPVQLSWDQVQCTPRLTIVCFTTSDLPTNNSKP